MRVSELGVSRRARPTIRSDPRDVVINARYQPFSFLTWRFLRLSRRLFYSTVLLFYLCVTRRQRWFATKLPGYVTRRTHDSRGTCVSCMKRRTSRKTEQLADTSRMSTSNSRANTCHVSPIRSVHLHSCLVRVSRHVVARIASACRFNFLASQGSSQFPLLPNKRIHLDALSSYI